MIPLWMLLPVAVALVGTHGAPADPVLNNPEELVCNCSAEGVVDPDECDPSTGQCVCLSGYTGLQCETCEEGYYNNGSTGCLPCTCDSYGAVNSLCDSSGNCVCKMGVYGPKCDDCQPGFFRFSSTGCQPCQCNNRTSYCHPQSGVCLNCQGNTRGPSCEECAEKHYRHRDALGTDACLPCPCPSLTSSGTCHLDAQGNPVCDQCATGFSGATCLRTAVRDLPPPSQLQTTTSIPISLVSESGKGVTTKTSPGTWFGGLSESPPTNEATPTGPTAVSWAEFNVIILAVIIVAVVVLMGVAGGIYTYREHQNRKLNAPFWTIELKEDNISFSSYHDALPNADVSGLLEDEANEVVPNGQLSLTVPANGYKA